MNDNKGTVREIPPIKPITLESRIASLEQKVQKLEQTVTRALR